MHKNNFVMKYFLTNMIEISIYRNKISRLSTENEDVRIELRNCPQGGKKRIEDTRENAGGSTMAGFMDMLGKKTEMESGSSYQKTVIREIARKLVELEEQNDQNAMSIEEIKKLQKMMLQKLDSLKAENDNVTDQGQAPMEPMKVEGLEQLQQQVYQLTQQMQAGVGSLDEKLQSVMEKVCEEQPEEETEDHSEEVILEKLDSMKLSLEDTVHKENIKCFRNVQGVLEEQGDGKAYDVNALRRYLKVIIWFQLITIVVLVLRILGFL